MLDKILILILCHLEYYAEKSCAGALNILNTKQKNIFLKNTSILLNQ